MRKMIQVRVSPRMARSQPLIGALFWRLVDPPSSPWLRWRSFAELNGIPFIRKCAGMASVLKMPRISLKAFSPASYAMNHSPVSDAKRAGFAPSYSPRSNIIWPMKKTVPGP